MQNKMVFGCTTEVVFQQLWQACVYIKHFDSFIHEVDLIIIIREGGLFSLFILEGGLSSQGLELNQEELWYM